MAMCPINPTGAAEILLFSMLKNLGETNVIFEGDTSTLGARLN